MGIANKTRRNRKVAGGKPSFIRVSSDQHQDLHVLASFHFVSRQEMLEAVLKVAIPLFYAAIERTYDKKPLPLALDDTVRAIGK
jgi:hypothetical protein